MSGLGRKLFMIYEGPSAWIKLHIGKQCQSWGIVQDLNLEEWGVGAMAANPDEAIPEVEEETSRLALVDLDWSKVMLLHNLEAMRPVQEKHGISEAKVRARINLRADRQDVGLDVQVQAVDIFAMLKSFVTKGQQIQRVTVYPSDYGLARMAEEAKLGPIGLFGSTRQSQGNSSAHIMIDSASGKPRQKEHARMVEDSEGDTSSHSDSDADSDRGGQVNGAESDDEASSDSEAEELENDHGLVAARDHDSDSGDEVDHRRLQMYERSRLRYYYAIVECDDVATAAQLYRECDGLEFEHSANKCAPCCLQ